MKKTLLAIAYRFCRLVSSALWQLLWLIPVGVLCWYGKTILPQAIQNHFGLDQARDRLTSLEQFAEVMKNNSSLTNPTALLHYISASFSKFAATTRLSTLEITTNILQNICLWGLNILWIVAVIYAIIRTIRLYKAKSSTYEIAASVTRQIQPQLILLQQEIAALRDEIQSLKEENLIESKQQTKKLLSHD